MVVMTIMMMMMMTAMAMMIFDIDSDYSFDVYGVFDHDAGDLKDAENFSF